MPRSYQSYGQPEDGSYYDYGYDYASASANNTGWHPQQGDAQYISDGRQIADDLIDPSLFSSSAAGPSTIASVAYQDTSPIYSSEPTLQGQ